MLTFGEAKIAKENFYAANEPFGMLILIIYLSQN